MTYGYCASIIATTLGQPSFIAYFELSTRSNSADLQGAINGLFQTGGLFGALSCTETADWLGRRKALLIAALFSVVGGALQAGSVNISMYIVMRFITGLGIGMFSSCALPPLVRPCSKADDYDVQERWSRWYLYIRVRLPHPESEVSWSACTVF